MGAECGLAMSDSRSLSLSLSLSFVSVALLLVAHALCESLWPVVTRLLVGVRSLLVSRPASKVVRDISTRSTTIGVRRPQAHLDSKASMEPQRKPLTMHSRAISA